MKGIHLIAFLASFTVIIASKLPDIFEAENECPPYNTSPPKLISHETNCAQYYECENGQKQLRLCAAGLYFSKYWRGCVNRDISDCPITASTPSPTPICDKGCCREGELLPHECQCKKFYQCKNGQKALKECPDGEVFIPEKSSCKPGRKDEKTGKCKETPCNPCEPVECSGNERKPHECICECYYECCNGRWTLQCCDDGWHYDNKTKGCIPGCCNTVCNENDKKNHECCCDKYYTCIKGNWVIEHCEDGQHFSNCSQTCMHPRDAHCTNYCPGDCSRNCIKTWRHECDCRLYYECCNGKQAIRECNWGDYWNKATGKCECKENVCCRAKNWWD